jgi:hypothetical protein
MSPSLGDSFFPAIKKGIEDDLGAPDKAPILDILDHHIFEQVSSDGTGGANRWPLPATVPTDIIAIGSVLARHIGHAAATFRAVQHPVRSALDELTFPFIR